MIRMSRGIALLLFVALLVGMPFVYADVLEDLRAQTGQEKPDHAGRIDSKSSHVIVDQREAGFIVFTGIPKETTLEQLEGYEDQALKLGNVQIISWQQFLDNIEKYSQSTILINDYKKQKAVEGVICLIGTQTAAPWGLTWNGGIALTRNDYNHVRKTYKVYKDNPQRYKPIRDPRADPVNPSGHLPFFGCSRWVYE